MLTRILAFLCRICPLCICARRWPKSRFARTMVAIEKGCPACRAYNSLHHGVTPEQIYEHQSL